MKNHFTPHTCIGLQLCPELWRYINLLTYYLLNYFKRDARINVLKSKIIYSCDKTFKLVNISNMSNTLHLYSVYYNCHFHNLYHYMFYRLYSLFSSLYFMYSSFSHSYSFIGYFLYLCKPKVYKKLHQHFAKFHKIIYFIFK